jgi:hypothetical protein
MPTQSLPQHPVYSCWNADFRNADEHWSNAVQEFGEVEALLHLLDGRPISEVRLDGRPLSEAEKLKLHLGVDDADLAQLTERASDAGT